MKDTDNICKELDLLILINPPKKIWYYGLKEHNRRGSLTNYFSVISNLHCTCPDCRNSPLDIIALEYIDEHYVVYPHAIRTLLAKELFIKY